MPCPPYVNGAEAVVRSEEELRKALFREGATWIRLARDIALAEEVDLSPLMECSGHQFLGFDSSIDDDPGARFVLRKEFDGGALLAWRTDRFGGGGEPPYHTLHFFVQNLVFDGMGRSGNLVEFHQSDVSYMRDVTFRNSGGHGLVLGPPHRPPGNSAHPEDRALGCPGTYQTAATTLLDCRAYDCAGVGVSAIAAIDLTIVGGEARGNGTDLRLIGPSFNDGCAGKKKWFRGTGSIVDWPSTSAELDLAYGVHTSGSMPVAGIATTGDCYGLDLDA